jgi:hypothetical protein
MYNYHMTTIKQIYIRIGPQVYPYAGTAVEPPDAQVSGISPTCEGLGMDEPSAADRAIRLSKLVETVPPPVLDLPPLRCHTPHMPERTFGNDTKAIGWLMHPGQGSACPVRLSASTRCGERAETAPTPADLRLIMGAIAARAQGLIEDRRRVGVWAPLPALSLAAKFGSRRGKLP